MWIFPSYIESTFSNVMQIHGIRRSTKEGGSRYNARKTDAKVSKEEEKCAVKKMNMYSIFWIPSSLGTRMIVIDLTGTADSPIIVNGIGVNGGSGIHLLPHALLTMIIKTTLMLSSACTCDLRACAATLLIVCKAYSEITSDARLDELVVMEYVESDLLNLSEAGCAQLALRIPNVERVIIRLSYVITLAPRFFPDGPIGLHMLNALWPGDFALQPLRPILKRILPTTSALRTITVSIDNDVFEFKRSSSMYTICRPMYLWQLFADWNAERLEAKSANPTWICNFNHIGVLPTERRIANVRAPHLLIRQFRTYAASLNDAQVCVVIDDSDEWFQ